MFPEECCGNFYWGCIEYANTFGKMIVSTMLILPVLSIEFLSIFQHLYQDLSSEIWSFHCRNPLFPWLGLLLDILVSLKLLWMAEFLWSLSLYVCWWCVEKLLICARWSCHIAEIADYFQKFSRIFETPHAYYHVTSYHDILITLFASC